MWIPIWQYVLVLFIALSLGIYMGKKNEQIRIKREIKLVEKLRKRDGCKW